MSTPEFLDIPRISTRNLPCLFIVTRLLQTNVCFSCPKLHFFGPSSPNDTFTKDSLGRLKVTWFMVTKTEQLQPQVCACDVMTEASLVLRD